MRYDKENFIVNKTFQFAIQIVAFCEELENNKKYVIARQLLKSGTSIYYFVLTVLCSILFS